MKRWIFLLAAACMAAGILGGCGVGPAEEPPSIQIVPGGTSADKERLAGLAEQFEKYLQDHITDQMPLEDIVGVFEEMCRLPGDDDLILFETGTYQFGEEPLFYFSLTRQFPNGEEEYFQIRVDVTYQPTEENKAFRRTVWDDDLKENIFDYIRNSEVFAYAKNQEYIQVEILKYET